MQAPSRLRVFLNCLLCLLAFAFTSAAIHRLLPVPNVPIVRPKLAYFTAHQEEFSAVFIGSSHTVTGVLPQAFDAALQEKGITVHSYNLAFPGMVPPEEFWVIKHVLAEKPRALKWMFVEVVPSGIGMGGESWDSLRNLYWRDGNETALVLRRLWSEAERQKKPKALWLPLPKKLAKRVTVSPTLTRRLRFIQEALPHVGLFLRNELNFGLIASFTASSPETRGTLPVDLDTGYYSQKETEVMPRDMANEYAARLAQLRAEGPPPDDPLTQNGFAGMLAEIRRHGITPVPFIAPSGRKDHFRVAPPRGEPVLAFNQPQKYPDLYDASRRRDIDHLNRAGAELFTRMLAEQFAATLGH